MPTPTFFASSQAFGRWLSKNAASVPELLVGYYKVGSGRPSMSWSESVDEALCFGWIDGVRRRIDDESYSIRFTPRKTNSIWSAVNMAKYERLRAEGRMRAAGETAFAHRKGHKSAVYAYEQEASAALSPQESVAFAKNTSAWAFFEGTPPSYRKLVLHWINTAKKAETRAARFAALVAACDAGKRLR